jgi:CTP synthase
MFCQVQPEQVIAVHNVSSTYHVPLLLEKQGLIPTIRDILRLDAIPKALAIVARGQAAWKEWQLLTKGQERFFETISIALVGKYVSLHDSYLSVIKSLEHSQSSLAGLATRHRGYDKSCRMGPDEQDSLPWHLLRHVDCGY